MLVSQSALHRWLDTLRRLLFDPDLTGYVALLCLLVEIPLNIAIIQLRAYTEIDWEAYMDEVRGAIDGEWDYIKLGGGTGPLVYPAGFVYLFGALYYMTDRGTNILRAQHIFASFYWIMLALIGYIYTRTKKCPPLVLIIMTLTSYRIHSVFVLRLFNDPLAMMLFYASVVCFLYDRWTIGCIMYSAAVSIKMNVFLFAPGLFYLLLTRFGFIQTVVRIGICAAVQVLLAAPFLWTAPWSYLSRAFDFGRVFLFKWTVNWRFLSEDVFLDRRFHIVLLVLHLAVITAFFCWKWASANGGLKALLMSVPAPETRVDPSVVVAVLFTSNFIGMAFSRSLHYQFYVWYYHTIPFLLWSTTMRNGMRVVVLIAIEISWNTYPSTSWSSAQLHIAHILLLVALWVSPHQLVPARVKSE